MSRRELSDSAAVMRSHSISFGSFLVFKKCSVVVDDPPEAPTWASKTYVFEVDDPLEARTWGIVFLDDFVSNSVFSTCL